VPFDRMAVLAAARPAWVRNSRRVVVIRAFYMRSARPIRAQFG
jgi:hypothetical protein